MTLDTLIMFGGAFVAVLPFLGFPASWDNVLLFIAGIAIIPLGVVVRRRGLGVRKQPMRGTHFEESRPIQELPAHEE